MIVSNDNNALQIKLENLEQLFVRSTSGRENISREYMSSNLVGENRMLRTRIEDLEDEVYRAREAGGTPTDQPHSSEDRELKTTNSNLKDRLEFLLKRERELTALVNKKKK